MNGRMTLLRALPFLAGLALTAGRADAATCFWVGGTGNFSDPTHWASGTGGTASTCAGTGGVPYTGSDSATLDASSGGGTVTMNVSANSTGTLSTAAFTGTMVDSGNAQSWGTVSNNGSGVRTYNWTGAWTITGSGVSAWQFGTTTNATITSLPSSITFTNTGSLTFTGGGLTYSDVSFTGVGATITMSAGTATFRDVVVTNATSYAQSGASAFSCRDYLITASSFTGSTTPVSVSRTLTIVAPAVVSGGGVITLNGSSGTQAVTFTGPIINPLTINNSGATTIITASGWAPQSIILTAGSVTINGSAVVGTNAFTHTAGSLTVNVPFTTTTYSGSNSNVRSLTLTRPWTFSTTGNVLAVGTSTNFTATCSGTGGFVVSDTSATNKTLVYSGSEILKCIKYLTPTTFNGWTATP